MNVAEHVVSNRLTSHIPASLSETGIVQRLHKASTVGQRFKNTKREGHFLNRLEWSDKKQWKRLEKGDKTILRLAVCISGKTTNTQLYGDLTQK